MIKVFGIKTCNSVKKALKFFKEHDIEVDFFDFKQEIPSKSLIESWIKQVGMDIIFNTRGTKYRVLKLKELNLDEKGKLQWLCKEPLLFKRPIIQKDDKVLAVGFDEQKYKKFIN